MSGTLIGIGVGPGDPELMTLKAVRLIKENAIIALPGKIPQETTAYKIALKAVPELAHKQLIPIHFPMTMDLDEQETAHKQGAKTIMTILDGGENVVFLTLGDVTIYSTFSYIQHYLEKEGYPVELVSGVPSFCAAAAALKMPLIEWTQSLHVLPALHRLDTPLDQPGTYVLMKSGSQLAQIKKILRESKREISMVENCGMPNEKIYHSLDEIPDDSGYFSLIIAK